VVAQSTAGVHVASVVALVAAATHRLLLRNQLATVRPWVLVASDVAVASEVDSTEDEVASEVVVVVLVVVAALTVEVVVDASAHRMEHLQALDLAVDLVVVTEAVALMTVARAATLTLSLCLLEEAIEEAIVGAIVGAIVEAIVVPTGTAITTVTALVPADMLDKSDLMTAVGMTNQGRDAATKVAEPLSARWT
jgi:hypothetical protein